MRNIYTRDAQQAALSFLVNQATYIESEVYNIQYPDIQYPMLVPVDTSAPDWVKSITFYSMDKVGKADWFHGRAKDVPLVDVTREKHEEAVSMAAVGYDYTLEELAQAQAAGINLTTDKAEAAYRAYEEFVDEIALSGYAAKNMTGLFNNPLVTVVQAPSSGSGTGGDSPTWADKTPTQIIADFNDALVGIYTGTQTVEMADTVLLPIAVHNLLANTQMTNIDRTVLSWIEQYNIYTAQTGQKLTIRSVRGLNTAGVGSSGRAVFYKRDPRVVKMHIPMPHRFLPPMQTAPLLYEVPGIFRLGGVEVRRPGSMRYLDGVSDADYE